MIGSYVNNGFGGSLVNPKIVEFSNWPRTKKKIYLSIFPIPRKLSMPLLVTVSSRHNYNTHYPDIIRYEICFLNLILNSQKV